MAVAESAPEQHADGKADKVKRQGLRRLCRTDGKIAADIGMTYQQWRQQWRLMKAVELLATGERITATAQVLDFASDSAFIYFFRTMTGMTPGRYFSPLTAPERSLPGA